MFLGEPGPVQGDILRRDEYLTKGGQLSGKMCLEATGDYLPPGGRARVTRGRKNPSRKSTRRALSGVALSRVPWER